MKLSIPDVLLVLAEELTEANEPKALRILVLVEALLQTEIFTSTRSVQEVSSILGPSIEKLSGCIELSEKVVIKAKKVLFILKARCSSTA
jgi:hypothetical protein